MSTRIQLYSIPTMDPIIEAVGSGDKKLLKAIASDPESEFHGWAKAMLSKSPPKKEPGAWNYVVGVLAEHFGLELKFLEVDDWKHYATWSDYIPMVKPTVSEESLEFLEMMKDGRPLKGTEIDHDGCCFSWFTTEEAKSLLACLKKVDASDVTDGECMEMFHQSLIDSLKIATKAGHAIFMASH